MGRVGRVVERGGARGAARGARAAARPRRHHAAVPLWEELLFIHYFYVLLMSKYLFNRIIFKKYEYMGYNNIK